MRRVVIISTLFIFCGTLIFGYFELGLKEYLAVRSYLRGLDEEQARQVQALYSGRAEDNVYGGILAGIYFNQLWLWSNDGLRHYPLTVGGSSYTYFSMCSDENKAKIAQGDTKLNIKREPITGEREAWSGKRGDYVRVEIDGAEVREAHGFDWWVFAQLPTKELCRE